MRRIQYHRYGGPEELKLEEVALPEPTGRQVRVRVLAAGVNPMDRGIRQGKISMVTGKRFPRGLGHDFAGIVDAVGPKATRFKIGDEVFSATGIREAGAFADAAIADEKLLMPKPASLSFEQAGALTIASMTAWTGLMDKAKLRAGQSVFIVGCLGAMGRAAVQIACLHGAVVSGSCNGAEREEALALGVGDVADYRHFDPAAYRGRFDIVFDTAHALSMKQSAAMLRPGGHVLHVDGFSRTMLFSLFSTRHISVIANAKPQTLAGVHDAASQGKLVPKIGRVAPLAEAIPAMIEQETTGLPKGKLVIVP